MYKCTIIGNFGNYVENFDGQTIKTILITDELKKNIDFNKINTVNTYNWTRKPFILFLKCLKALVKSKNIIIMPAQNGIRVFSFIFTFFNYLFKRKIHYIVIGGWLPDLIRSNRHLKKRLMKFTGIYVETNSIKKELENFGLSNVYVLYNFKNLRILNENDLVYNDDLPLKVCIFSRIMKEKGIEDAINVIKDVNQEMNKVVYCLDIYGPIDNDYKDRFNQLRSEFPEYIQYLGVVNFNESVDVLKNYNVLLFPTRFRTEGIPGTILDAYSAGVPVIASEWNSAKELIDDGETGFIYEFENIELLKRTLIKIAYEPNILNGMRLKCLTKAYNYTADKVIKVLLEKLD